MENSRSILSIKEYGKIDICLKEVLEKRGVTRNALAKATNTRFEVIAKWCCNKVEKLDLDVLARICYVLECSPSEIVRYRDDCSEG